MGKVESLRKNTFKPWMINTFGKQKEVFQKLISIAGVVSLETFPNNKELEIKDFIANFIKNLSQNA